MYREQRVADLVERVLFGLSEDCWNCHHATDCCAFFCKSCDAIQPISSENHCDYFEMFKMYVSLYTIGVPMALRWKC